MFGEPGFRLQGLTFHLCQDSREHENGLTEAERCNSTGSAPRGLALLLGISKTCDRYPVLAGSSRSVHSPIGVVAELAIDRRNSTI
jgi:hypothetical protein